MIAALNGTVLQKDLARVVVDVGGVGYLVHVSMQTHADLPAPGEQVRLLCHTHVREDSLQIFGFLAAEELSAFELLILVSGVGPKLALTALSGMPVGELIRAIATSDHQKLQSIPGVGRKTAERIVVDLKDRCAKIASSASTTSPRTSRPREEVVDALVNLGYKRLVAEKAVERAEEAGGGGSLEELLRQALMAVRAL